MSGIEKGLESLGNSITSGLNNIVTGLTNLGEHIVWGIGDLFLPDENFLKNEVAQIRERFAFADSIVATVNTLHDLIETSAAEIQEPPSIVMDINIRGTVKEVTVIDMSWYKPYKEYGDMLFSGILWAFFVWRIFVRLPGIISGASSGIDFVFRRSGGIERSGGDE